MSNEAPLRCPQCGTPIKEDAPAGLCPNCLMALNLRTETVFSGDAPALPPPLPPAQIAPHFPQLEILEYLGRGGMGVVYKARQKSLNRVVALKLLAPERVTDTRFAERFTREAHALAALNHPHIVTIHDFGQAGGFYFLLMEFVDGVNLRQLLEARRLTPEEALAIVPPLCDALQYAHEHGIVHRDIKPGNLLLDQSGRVKIADFGIAKMVGDDSSVGLAESQPAGTPQYMAPEQKSHQRTDHRADIYSLGVVLYEMLTGELPADKLQPPSRKVLIDVRLDEIVLRALERTPELRYQTAGEMRAQVQTVVSTPGRSGPGVAHTVRPLRPPKVSVSTLTTPAEISTFRGQLFLYRTRGPLVLDDRQLTHSRAGIDTAIPLTAIRDLGIGQYPRTVNPAGINFLSVTYEENGQRQQVLLSPMKGLIGLPSTFNAHIAEWHAAIRDAVVAATGQAPASSPVAPGGTPLPSFVPMLAMAAVPVLVAMALMMFIRRHEAAGGFAGAVGLFEVAVFVGSVSAVLLLNWFFAGWIRQAAWGQRLLGLGLLLLGVVLGLLQLREASRAQVERFAFLAAEIPRLQKQWSDTKAMEFVARTTLSRFEAEPVTPQSEAERQENESKRGQLQSNLADAVKRGDDIQAQIPATHEAISQLRFPDATTFKRLFWSAGPLMVGGLFLMLRRGARRTNGAENVNSSSIKYAGLLMLLLPVVLFAFFLLLFFARGGTAPPLPNVTSLEGVPMGVSNHIQVAVPLTAADPNWVSVFGQSTHNESRVTLNWEILASQPGLVRFQRDHNLSTAVLQTDGKTKLYRVRVRVDLTKLDANRVLLVMEKSGVTTREEFPGRFADLAAELLRTRTLSARPVRGASVELCQFQGKPFTVQL